MREAASKFGEGSSTGGADMEVIDRPDRVFEPFVDAVQPVAQLDAVRVARPPSPVVVERRVRDGEEVRDGTCQRLPGGEDGRVERHGWDRGPVDQGIVHRRSVARVG
jgi:hypothetical protein